MTEITSTSLAILKVNLDEEERDYIDYMINFVIHSLNTHAPEIVTDDAVSKYLEEDFGLSVPQKGAQFALRRLAKRRYLSKEEGTYTITSKLPNINISNKQKDTLRNIEKVLKSLILYAKSCFQHDWSDERAINALLNFFSRFGIDYLRAYIFRTTLPRTENY
uniref:Uncharacterized protein n=1 Tax=Candidatus Kentrum sp. TC TaxID=2126339 RepID=A0A450YLI4_9GAMM|nr:MAG: hypothetical protein BECKTC1821E_GA0114239_101631 [Candidatus Kentron sp. TC]VFK42414.1 MAG: hypothetical protein BECKTC1821D_GA0114238_101231 [Candidatus Kentron sp. TC]